MARQRTITLKLTEDEAKAIMDTANSGIADMHDAGDDASLAKADVADAVLNRLGAAMVKAWPAADVA